MVSKPRIGLTMGDPAGVGPEVVLQALSNKQVLADVDLVLFGDHRVLQRCADQLSLPYAPELIVSLEQFEDCDLSKSRIVVDLDLIPAAELQIGQVSKLGGMASYKYIQSAIDAALADRIAAVTTAPINKEALRAAGINYPGHTEMFADRANASRWCMMQYSPEITCTFVTVHVGYNEVPQLLSEARVLDTIELTHEGVGFILGRAPQIVVCGLNPHAGEHGLFGNREEENFIIPAIEKARQRGMQVEGPLPPDTAFLPAKRKTSDAFVCMYHDQGHIPVKALAFDSAVNTTLGLNMIRTSVDHGTAYDIAWQGLANPNSLYSAIDLARRLTRQTD